MRRSAQWGRWLEQADRRVDWTGNKDRYVSTVFLGLDHRYFGGGPPMVFETMVFVNGEFEDCVRYASWDDAEAGHKAMCARVFKTKVQADG